MNLITALASAVGQRRPPPFDPAVVDHEAGDEAQAAACGWFDSSYELSHGLEVVELDFDAFRAAA